MSKAKGKGQRSNSNHVVASWSLTLTELTFLSIHPCLGQLLTNLPTTFSYQTHLFPEVVPERIILIGSIAASLYFILGAFTGRFADLLGYRVALVLGSSLMIGSLFASSVATQYWHLFLSQGLMFGIGLAFVYPPASTISRQYFPHR